MVEYSQENNIEFRLVRETDLKDLAFLLQELSFNPNNSKFNNIYTAYRECSKLHNSFYCWIALDKSGILGTITLWVIPSLLHNGSVFGQIENLVVKPEVRRLGIGGELLKKAEEKAIQKGCYKLILNTTSNNLRFYYDNGFKDISYCMRKDLK